MSEKVKHIKEYLLNSPLLLIAVDSILTILFGVLCGTFVTEITIDGKINWKQSTSSASLYFLIVLVIIYSTLKRLSLHHDREIMLFKDTEYCRAYALSQMLPEMAKKAKEKIRNGNGSEFKDAMEELEKVLK